MTEETYDEAHRKNVLRAQAYFEKKAGRPVTLEETEEWLISLMEYFDILRRWQESPPTKQGGSSG